MKTLAAIVVLTATGAVQADGFKPWNDRAIQSTPDSIQAPVGAGSYYRGDVRQDAGVDATGQAGVIVGPFYARERV